MLINQSYIQFKYSPFPWKKANPHLEISLGKEPMVCSFNMLYYFLLEGSSMFRTGSSIQEERDVKGVYIGDIFAILFIALCGRPSLFSSHEL